MKNQNFLSILLCISSTAWMGCHTRTTNEPISENKVVKTGDDKLPPPKGPEYEYRICNLPEYIKHSGTYKYSEGLQRRLESMTFPVKVGRALTADLGGVQRFLDLNLSSLNNSQFSPRAQKFNDTFKSIYTNLDKSYLPENSYFSGIVRAHLSIGKDEVIIDKDFAMSHQIPPYILEDLDAQQQLLSALENDTSISRNALFVSELDSISIPLFYFLTQKRRAIGFVNPTKRNKEPQPLSLKKAHPLSHLKMNTCSHYSWRARSYAPEIALAQTKNAAISEGSIFLTGESLHEMLPKIQNPQKFMEELGVSQIVLIARKGENQKENTIIQSILDKFSTTEVKSILIDLGDDQF